MNKCVLATLVVGLISICVAQKHIASSRCGVNEVLVPCGANDNCEATCDRPFHRNRPIFCRQNCELKCVCGHSFVRDNQSRCVKKKDRDCAEDIMPPEEMNPAPMEPPGEMPPAEMPPAEMPPAEMPAAAMPPAEMAPAAMPPDGGGAAEGGAGADMGAAMRAPVRRPEQTVSRDPLVALPDSIVLSIPNLSIDLDILSLGGLLGDAQANRKPATQGNKKPTNNDPLIQGPSSVVVSIPDLSIDANVASLPALGGLLGGLLGDSQQPAPAIAGAQMDPLLTIPDVLISVPDLSVDLDVLSLG